MELQNLRKSLRNENSGLLDDATQLALDASWVCYDEADAEEVDDGSTHVGKAPRVRCITLVPRTCVCARACVCVRVCGMRKCVLRHACVCGAGLLRFFPRASSILACTVLRICSQRHECSVNLERKRAAR